MGMEPTQRYDQDDELLEHRRRYQHEHGRRNAIVDIRSTLMAKEKKQLHRAIIAHNRLVY